MSSTTQGWLTACYRVPVRADGRLFYADLDTGVINEFQLPQFTTTFLPNGLTVHGFGEDNNGELYALATNTNSAGTGGIVYAIGPVPEPGVATLLIGGSLLVGARRRTWYRKAQGFRMKVS